MEYLVSYLEARGYVERLPDPADRRAKIVRLTPRGWEVVAAGHRIIAALEAEWAALVEALLSGRWQRARMGAALAPPRSQ